MNAPQISVLVRFGALGRVILFGIGLLWEISLRGLRCLIAASRSPLAKVWQAVCWLAWQLLVILLSLIYLFAHLLLIAAVIAVALFLVCAMIVMLG